MERQYVPEVCLYGCCVFVSVCVCVRVCTRVGGSSRARTSLLSELTQCARSVCRWRSGRVSSIAARLELLHLPGLLPRPPGGTRRAETQAPRATARLVRTRTAWMTPRPRPRPCHQQPTRSLHVESPCWKTQKRGEPRKSMDTGTSLRSLRTTSINCRATPRELYGRNTTGIWRKWRQS